MHGIPVLSGTHGASSAKETSSTSGTPPDSPTTSHPLSATEPAQAQAHKSLVRQVVFARSGDRAADDGAEKDGNKQMSVAQLKDAASDKSPAGASQRQQAKQLLALKKIELDLLVVRPARSSPRPRGAWTDFSRNCHAVPVRHRHHVDRLPRPRALARHQPDLGLLQVEEVRLSLLLNFAFVPPHSR